MNDNKLHLGMISIEIDIICPIKHFREIIDNKIIVSFNSKISATKGYKYIASRYNNVTMFNDMKFSVVKDNDKVIVSYINI